MSGFLLAGDLYLQRLDDDTTGLIGPIETDKLALKGSAEEKSRTSKRKGSYGQAVGTVYIGKPTEISIVFSDQPAELLALAMLGKRETVNQAAATLTDHPVTLPANGRWVEIGHKNLGTLTIKDASDDSALAIGTDVEINYVLGLVRAVPGGAMEGGGVIEISGSALAVTGSRIRGGLVPNVRMKLMMDGKNLETGKPVRLTIPEAVLTPDGEVDFFSADYISTSLSGKVLLANGQTEPFTVDEVETAA